MNIFNMNINEAEKLLDETMKKMPKTELIEFLRIHGALKQNTYKVRQDFYEIKETKNTLWSKIKGQFSKKKLINKSKLQEAA